MKRTITISVFLALMVLPFVLNAQPWKGKRFHKQYYGYANFMYYGVGAKYGFDFVDFDMKYSDPADKYEFSSKNNFHVGVSGEYFVKYNLNLRVDVLLTQRELRLNYNYGDELNTSTDRDHTPDYIDWNLKYISIPLRVNYNYLYTQYVKGFVSAGFGPEFKSRFTEKVKYLSGREQENYKLLHSNGFSDVNLTVNFSLGFRYNFTAHTAFEIEGGVSQYLAKFNREYSAGAPNAYFLDFAFFYDFEGSGSPW